MQFKTSQEVIDLQNKEENLLLQYAARDKYNLSEYLSYFSWVMCFFSALLSVFSSSTIISVLSFGLDVVALVVTYIISINTSQAGDLRELFDSNTLGYTTKFTVNKIASLKETSLKYKSSSSYKESSTHNGHDDPPGVKDWYEFSAKLDASKTQKECIYQNIWWNKKMTLHRIRLTIITGIIFIALSVVAIKIYSGLSKAAVIGIASIIIFKIVDSLKNNAKYFKLSNDIDVLYAHLEIELTDLLLISIQEKINQRRHLKVFEINAIHKKNATRLSDLYRSTH